MTDVRARRVAWAIAGAALACFLAGIGVGLAAGDPPSVQAGFLLAIGAGYGVVGVLIASSAQRNRLAWVYLGVALSTGIAGLAGGVSAHDAPVGHPWRGAVEVAAVVASASWIGWVLVPASFLLLWFPDGQLVSPRWRVVGWAAVVGVGGEYVVALLRPGPVEGRPEIVNPLAVSWIEALEPVTTLFALLAIVASAISVVQRFRRADGVLRQQIKWLALAGGVTAPVILVAVSAYEELGETVANTVIQLAVLAVPLAAGVGILRYRLYDVDLVVNRTLVYATLTATLVMAYVALVLLLQVVLSPLTERSDLAVAASTLAVAALVRPARARIQRFVDRRFYRTRYDAARTMASFSATLRNEVDLDALGRDLRAAVGLAMQPSHVGLWLREGQP